MKWRVILKMSFTNDPGSKLRNRVAQCLAECGIKPSIQTSTWEGNAVSASEATKQFEKVFSLLSNPNQIAGIRRARLDHLWIYIDRVIIPKVNAPTKKFVR